ncbi:MAG: DUF2938 family protein [Chloroflexota bacterium]
MPNPGAAIVSAILMGLGGTLVFDLWGLLLKRFFQIAPSNICLVGRWLRGMFAGRFRHDNIAAAPPQPGEEEIRAAVQQCSDSVRIRPDRIL